MTTQKTIYAVYRYEMLMHQYGESYTDERTGTESQDLGAFESEAEALQLLDSIKGELAYEITRTKSGLDSIAYDEACVNKELVEVDEDGYEDLLESETLHVVSGLPDEVRDAAYKSQRTYHEYLDYQEDGYLGINDVM